MSQPSLDALRHTAAHVLAYAVQDLFPEAKPTIGPSIESGFYYDFDRPTPFTAEDLAKLEARMREIVKADYEMTGRRVSREEALDRYAGNEYKREIAEISPRATRSRSTRSARSPTSAAAAMLNAPARSARSNS